MVCSRCGKEIPDESVFCLYCGTAVHNPSAGARNAHVYSEAIINKCKRTGCIGWTLAILMVLFILLILSGGMAFYITTQVMQP